MLRGKVLGKHRTQPIPGAEPAGGPGRGSVMGQGTRLTTESNTYTAARKHTSHRTAIRCALTGGIQDMGAMRLEGALRAQL